MRNKGPKKQATPQQRLILRLVALFSYLILFSLVIAWNTLIAPSQSYPTGLVLLFSALPLLFPFWGILRGKAYTHAWASFLALYYFILGVGDAYSDPVDQYYGIAVTGLSIVFFISSMLYARFQGLAEQVANADTPVEAAKTE